MEIKGTVQKTKQDGNRFALLLDDENWYSCFLDSDKKSPEFIRTMQGLQEGMNITLDYYTTPAKKEGGATFRNIKGIDVLDAPESAEDEPDSSKPPANRELLIIRQTASKCGARILSAMVQARGIEGIGAEEAITIAKRFELYVLTGD